MKRATKRMAGVGLLGMLWLSAGATRAEEQDRVGKFGDVWRWRISGAVQVEEDEVRRAVRRDLRTQLACHPLAPRSELATTVSQKLQVALQNSGFAEARVDARLDLDAKRLCVDIFEGPQSVCGEVRIEGSESISAEALRERLTRPYPPARAVRPQTVQVGAEQVVKWFDRRGQPVALSDPIWQVGKPAPLSAQAQSQLEREVAAALADLGYCDARFEVLRQSHAETRTVDLTVKIAERGQPTSLQTISVTGQKRFTDAAILAWLDLHPGEVLTRRRLVDLEHQLWRSGRFIQHHITAEALTANAASRQLKIELQESPYSGPLDEEWGREAKALLRARDWLGNPDGWGADLVFTRKVQDGVLELVLSPQQGAMLVHRPADDDRPPGFVVASTADRIFCRIAGVSGRLELPLPELGVELQIVLTLQSEPKSPDHPFQTTLGAGYQSKPAEHLLRGSLLRLSLNIAPSAAQAFLYLPGSRVSWQGTELTVETERERIVVEETSGQLLHFQTKAETDGMTITFVPAAYAQRWADLRPVIETPPNVFDANRPVSSCLEFLVDGLAALPESRRATPGVQKICESMPTCRTLLERGILQDVDALLANSRQDPRIRLNIPDEGGDQSNWLGAIVGNLAFLATDTCFPHGSWPWIVCREVAFALANESKYLQPTLQQFQRDEQIGPVGALVVSRLVERMDVRLSRQFATRGLRDTSVDGFRRDFLPLLDDGALLGKLLARLAIVLQEVDEATIARAIGSLPEGDRLWFAATVAQLRQGRQLPLELAIALALEQGWQSGLRARVAAALAERRGRDAFPIPLDTD